MVTGELTDRQTPAFSWVVGLASIVWLWAFTNATVACSLLLVPIAGMGLVYLFVALVTGAWFVSESHRLFGLAIRHAEVSPMRVFHGSIVYLTLLFVAVGIDPLLPFQAPRRRM